MNAVISINKFKMKKNSDLNNEKDLLISKIKSENFALRNREGDYEALALKILDIEKRYQISLKEKEKLEQKNIKNEN